MTKIGLATTGRGTSFRARDRWLRWSRNLLTFVLVQVRTRYPNGKLWGREGAARDEKESLEKGSGGGILLPRHLIS